jgi:hypothetical protein
MAHIQNLGSRIELVPMDPHFHDISLALYESPADTGPQFLVHTYSQVDGAAARVATVTAAMKTLGGMAEVGGGQLRFSCGAEHRLACKRLFLEACKLAPETALETRPMCIVDKKSERMIRVLGHGGGAYQVTAEGGYDGVERRLGAIGGGLAKLAELDALSEARDRVAFGCGQDHDALIGLLLQRALNVRTAMREAEERASRGILAAPSAQNT